MKLLEKLGGAAAPKRQWSPYPPVRDSADLRRIESLPRRTYAPAQAAALAAKWTELLRRPEGTQTLRPIQGVALEEAFLYDGLYGMIGVGWGKTLVSLLLPTVWGSRNAVLLVPPELRRKLFDLEYPVLSKHWRLPGLAANLASTNTEPRLHVISYSQLSSAQGSDLLGQLDFDDCILDEAHCLRYSTSARTKRWRRYVFTPRPVPTPPVSFGDDYRRSGGVLRRRTAVLSGTLATGSIVDGEHLVYAALGDGAPVPHDWHTRQEWSHAIDETEFPSDPGALRRLCDGAETVRSGYRRRLIETPGVVATTENDPGMSLTFDRVPLKVPKELARLLKQARGGLSPDGDVLKEAIEVYAVTRQLACGFYYRKTYPRGESPELIAAWEEARRAYYGELSYRLSRSIAGQDSELLCWRAAEKGVWASEHFARWRGLKDEVQPARETVWVSRFMVDAALRWASKAPGIVWVETVAVRELAEETGLPVYAGAADAGRLSAETGERSIIVSIDAFNKGVDLTRFSRNLVTLCPPSSDILEQTIGRTHRPGQKADCVSLDFFLHAPELETALKTARTGAARDEEISGNRQKLNIGTWLFEL